jgi:hypothetical protein
MKNLGKIVLDPSKVYALPIKKGHLDIRVSTDSNYPGLDVEYISDIEYSRLVGISPCKSRPRVLIETAENTLRALIWGNPHSEDYSESIEFKCLEDVQNESENKPRTYEELCSEILPKERELIYRIVHKNYVSQDVLNRIREKHDLYTNDLTDEELKPLCDEVAEMYVFNGDYDCNLPYWSNIDALLDETFFNFMNEVNRQWAVSFIPVPAEGEKPCSSIMQKHFSNMKEAEEFIVNNERTHEAIILKLLKWNKNTDCYSPVKTFDDFEKYDVEEM